MFMQGTCAEPHQGVPHGFAQELNSIACQEDMNFMSRFNRRRCDNEGESCLGRVLRPAGDVDEEAGHEHLTQGCT
jgi:hypothetical protein